MLPSNVPLASKTPEVFEQIDDFMVKIEDNIKAFLARLLEEGRKRYRLSFLELLGKGDVLEAVRMFLMLLFLVADGKVALFQDAEFGDIGIELRNTGSPGNY